MVLLDSVEDIVNDIVKDSTAEATESFVMIGTSPSGRLTMATNIQGFIA